MGRLEARSGTQALDCHPANFVKVTDGRLDSRTLGCMGACSTDLIRSSRLFIKVEVAVLGSPSLIVLMVSVGVKLHSTRTGQCHNFGAVCEGRGGRPGLPPVPNSPYGLCGRKATLNSTGSQQSRK